MTRRIRSFALLVSLVALGPVLSACADFDMDKLDVFGLNEKKKLPGDRRALFPEGIPGVQQGVPPELIKGHQASVEPVDTPAVAAPPVEKPKPKKPRVAKRQPTRVTVQPGAAQEPADTSWPSTQQPAQQTQSPWPDAPRTGTFSR